MSDIHEADWIEEEEEENDTTRYYRSFEPYAVEFPVDSLLQAVVLQAIGNFDSEDRAGLLALVRNHVDKLPAGSVVSGATRSLIAGVTSLNVEDIMSDCAYDRVTAPVYSILTNP